MPIWLTALFSAWDVRLDATAILLTCVTIYGAGWWHLRSNGHVKLAQKRRIVFYFTGLFLIAIALMSPVDLLGGQLLFMHMVQHKLMIMFAAPLLWLGRPFPIALWGLPMWVRKHVASFFVRDSAFRHALSAVTTPGIAWLTFVTIYLGWHDPNLYNAALRSPWVHDLEHVTFFGSAMLFWWHALNAAPHIHGRIPVWERIAMTVSIIPANMIAGVTIATANHVIYTYYETVPHVWGFTALQDQAAGGMIMWVPGSEMIVWAVIFQLSMLTRHEKSKAQATVRETLPV